MEIICIEEQAFYDLIETVYQRLKKLEKKQEKWVGPEEAMRLLRVKSKTTMQKLRDEGRIRYSQPFPQTILYDTASIDAFLEKHARELL